MKKMVFLLAAAGLVAASCGTKHPGKTVGINYDYMDATVKPGDDFAQYATGHWGDFNPQPPEYPSWGAFNKLAEENTKTLAGLIQEIAAKDNEKGSIAQKIGDLYTMAMDSTRLNADGAAPLRAHLAELDAIKTREELLKKCATEHDNLLFSMYVGADEKDSDNNIVSIGQGGLTLRNKEYYTSQDPQNVKVREATKEHMKNLFVLAGYPEKEAAAKVARIWALETELAAVHYSMEDQRIPEKNYHKMSVDELTQRCKPFDWKSYLKEYRYDQTGEVDLGQPEPVAKACRLLMTAPLETLKDIYRWQIINGGSSLLSDDFAEENFAYSRKIYGTREITPRWKRAVGLVDGLMGDAVGQLYVEKYFPPEAKTEMLDLVGKLQKSLGERIQAQEWMTEETKAKALDKLAAFTVKVGYPDKWDDLTPLVIDPEKTLYENVRAASDFYWKLNYDKRYNKPVDKDEWLMPAQMVNAYYNPTTNEICFPAGILQPPFFDPNADAAANYGAIGVVIGHEMTHGFDDQGRQFDKDGNFRDWWAEGDGDKYNERAQVIKDFFSAIKVLPDLNGNGDLCCGENLGDHGGLKFAYAAFKNATREHPLPVKEGFTPEQRFFLAYAGVWAQNITEAEIRRLTTMDPHSLGEWRVNGALPLVDAWYDAFGITEADPMFVPADKRVKIW